MARNENGWDRDRDFREHDRDAERDRERSSYEERRRREAGGQRSSDYGSHAGWGGQGFSQGSFGSYGSQGERMYNQYGGQGFGAEHGYSGRETGGGMSNYSSGNERRQGGYGQGSEDWGRERFSGESRREENYGRGRDEWDREHGQSYSGREASWGGYGSYDRERNRGMDYERRGNQGWASGGARQGGEPWRSSNPFGTSGNWAMPGHGASASQWENSGNQGFTGNQGFNENQWGNTGSSNMGYGGGQFGSNQYGRHSGRGPKGYQRSDDRIREDINEQLTRHPDIDASDIEIDVHNGEVTLKGAVEHRSVKRQAEDVAEQVSGVRQVHNQLRVEYQHSTLQSNQPALTGSSSPSGSSTSGSSVSGLSSGTGSQSPSQQRQNEPVGSRK